MNVDQSSWQQTGFRWRRAMAAQIASATAQAIATLLLWQERGRQRRSLARLDAALLRDIGRSHREVGQECAKPVWRA